MDVGDWEVIAGDFGIVESLFYCRESNIMRLRLQGQEKPHISRDEGDEDGRLGLQSSSPVCRTHLCSHLRHKKSQIALGSELKLLRNLSH